MGQFFSPRKPTTEDIYDSLFGTPGIAFLLSCFCFTWNNMLG